MINVYMLQAQADSFWSSEASVNGPNYVSRTEKTMFEETFPVGILRTQAGLSSCDSRGYSKQRTAVALGTSNVQSELLIKRLQHHLLSANQTVWFTGSHTDHFEAVNQILLSLPLSVPDCWKHGNGADFPAEPKWRVANSLTTRL